MAKGDGAKRTLVGVLDSHDHRIGAGFYIGDRLILTCAHVIQDNGRPPPKSVAVVFEALRGKPLQAKPLVILPPVWDSGLWQDGDIALLELPDDPPEGAMAAPLVCELPANALLLGHPNDNPNLTQVDATVKISYPQVELRSSMGDNITIEPGFSGSSVFDGEADQVIGLLRSGIPGTKKAPGRQAYMLPVETIVRQLPQLQGYISNKYIRLSTAEKRKTHHAALCEVIKAEREGLKVQTTFDYRIGPADGLDAIRAIHVSAVLEVYPASYWKPSKLLDQFRLESPLFSAQSLLFQAPGGSGKSLFVRDIVQMALRYLMVPYCVDLKRSERPATNSANPEDTLRGLFAGTLKGGSTLLLQDLDADRLCLLIVDGLNEVSNEDASRWLALLRDLSENHENIRIIVCDRTIDRSDGTRNAQLMTVHPLSKEAINGEMTQAKIAAVKDAKTLNLLSTPFFLHMALLSAASAGRSGVLAASRLEMFEKYFRQALDIAPAGKRKGDDRSFTLVMNRLSELAFAAYQSGAGLFLSDDLWARFEADTVKLTAAEPEVGPRVGKLRDRLLEAGAVLAVKSGKQTAETFRHQLLHDYLAGLYLSRSVPDYAVLHGATWHGENPEPVHFALEAVGQAGADGFLNHVYDWNYSVAIGSIRNQEQSDQPTTSDYYRGTVAALIALKTTDHFIETRLANQRDLGFFKDGLAKLCHDAVMPPEAEVWDDERKIGNLLETVEKSFPDEAVSGALDYPLWKRLFCRRGKPESGDERSMFLDNPLVGWTAASAFRRTGFDSWFVDRLKGAYRGLRETGVRMRGTEAVYDAGSRVARRRIVFVLGTAGDDDTAGMIHKIVFNDVQEDEDVRNDALRSLLEIASKQIGLRRQVLDWIDSGLEGLTPRLRRRILKSYDVQGADADWRKQMIRLLERARDFETDEETRARWTAAKDKLALTVGAGK